ncbi:Ldh family oxidoreductase [Martelella alba]|uniref:Ldh family oxidoreductase n=1 Tax=Martelella alba TaxID=2590451 RepID=A0ABY2SLY8_9HYPH|nr:Ldh family oxidoreductase [Martelella alba]TKI06080.1 Ldh family oxidoreductase [Martelella alba]
MKTISIQAVVTLAQAGLERLGVPSPAAAETVQVLLSAERAGVPSHGFARLPFYLAQLRSGKLQAAPTVSCREQGAIIVIDAGYGLAFPAVALGLRRGMVNVKTNGITAVSIRRSHHFGMAGYYVEQAAERGVLALAMSNTPAAMAPWGGCRPVLGTNPLAFSTPRARNRPLTMDLSLSEAARGKIMLADQQHQPIPAGWALDAQGRPTTDAKAALAGSLLPAGGAKGAALALMVELLTAGLAGGNFAFQASSFFTAEGNAPDVAQLLLLIDPGFFHPGYLEHIEALLSAMLEQPGVRLPGDRRARFAARAEENISLSDSLLADLTTAASAG